MPICLAEGYPPERIRVYADNDVSAYSGKTRPRYRQLLRDIESGEVTFVAVWHTDRLHRLTSELEEFIELVHPRGVAVRAARSGPIDLSTPAGRAVAKTICAWSQYESEHKAERIARQKRQQREQGKPSGGPRPFGWAPKTVVGPDGRERQTWDPMVHDPEEAALIRQAVADLLAGASLADVTRQWRELGISQPQSGRPSWTVDGVRQVVSNPRNAGLIGHRVEMPGRRGRGYVRYARPVVIGPALWPAIVDRDRWERLMAVLEQRGAVSAVPRRRSLLTGVLSCGRCGGRMVRAASAGARDRGRAVYRCPSPSSGVYPDNCGRVSIDAEGVEDALARTIFRTLRTERLARLLADRSEQEGTAEVTLRMRELETRMAEAAASFADGKISIHAYERIAAANEAQQRELRKKLVTSSGMAVPEPLFTGAGDLRERWKTLSLDQRRVILRTAFKKVVIAPGKPGMPSFDGDRIQVDWAV